MNIIINFVSYSHRDYNFEAAREFFLSRAVMKLCRTLRKGFYRSDKPEVIKQNASS